MAWKNPYEVPGSNLLWLCAKLGDSWVQLWWGRDSPRARVTGKSFVEGGELDVGADGWAGYGQAEESGKAFWEGGAT